MDRDMLLNLPNNISMYKCHNCKLVFDIHRSDMPMLVIFGKQEDTKCIKCGMSGVELMCKVDVYSVHLKLNNIVSCRRDEMISGVDMCPVCGRVMCPECYNHDCISLSRVTGYIQSVDGWNEGKKQELKDRKRYTIRHGEKYDI